MIVPKIRSLSFLCFFILVSLLSLSSSSSSTTTTATPQTTTTISSTTSDRTTTNRRRGSYYAGSHHQQRKQRILHFELRPTAALEEERRRRLSADNDDWNPPSEWFHPHVRAVYAGLDDSTNSSSFQEFQKSRHLSRFERHLRQQHTPSSSSTSLFEWSGNYSEYFVIHNDGITSNGTRKQRRRLRLKPWPSGSSADESQQQADNTASSSTYSSLKGGQFNQYQGVPLSQGYGTHYVHLWVGSPVPQRQTAIVDTGSHFTAFPCQGCKNCGQQHHTDPHFDPLKSQSFHSLVCPNECVEHFTCYPSKLAERRRRRMTTNLRNNPTNQSRKCYFAQAYAEGSAWEAYQAKDVIYLGGNDLLEAANPLDRQFATELMFGCLLTESGLFVTQLADGIMGMSLHESILPKQMYNHGFLEYNMFAMCFRNELGTSKGRGVTAGSMTLGGVASTLDTSPMLYARNTKSYGYYTVYVRKMYVAKKGGTKFLFQNASSAADDSIVQIPIRERALNSGKGVIIDSGTTDTYLNSRALPDFLKVWKSVTGKGYTHRPMYLTQAQLRRLPTILIQMEAAPLSSYSPYGGQPEYPSVARLGEVGLLDPEYPRDVLLAFPATHYMEYSTTLRMYTSRLFFTETEGGVLGANAMQGHNIMFDGHYQRIGFSQSSCAYDLIEEDYHNQKHANSAAAAAFSSEDEPYYNQCILGDPILTQTCMASIDVSICQASDQPNNVQVMGTEIWSRIVESPGNRKESCQEVMLEEEGAGDPESLSQQLDDSIFNCTSNGLCHEYRPCQVPCARAMEYHEKQYQQATDEISKEAKLDIDTNRIDGKKKENVNCENSFWSACDYNCYQSRIETSPLVLENNKEVCLEISRSSRPCHVDVCGRSDPCVVPYLVHAILVLEGNGIMNTNSSSSYLIQFIDTFVQSFHKVAHSEEFFSFAPSHDLFQPGDVDVLIVRPWYGDDAEEEEALDEIIKEYGVNTTVETLQEPLGVQIILHISIANPNFQRVNRSRNLLQEIGVIWSNLTEPFRTAKATTTCHNEELYPLAKDAVELANDILGKAEFGDRLAQEIPACTKGRVVSSWTIETEVNDAQFNNLGPTVKVPYAAVFRGLFQASIMLIALFLIGRIHYGLMKVRQRSCRSCTCRRSLPIIHRWQYYGAGARYQSVPTDNCEVDDNNDNDDDSLTDKILGNVTPTIHMSPVKDVELSYAHTFSDIHKKAGSNTKLRRITEKGIMLDLKN